MPPLNEVFLLDDDQINSQSMNRKSGLSPVGTATSYARLDRNVSIRTPMPSPLTNCRLLTQAMLILLSAFLHVFLGLPVAFDCMERPRQRTTLRMVLYQVVSILRRGLLPIIDALEAFCCWEVLIVALIMIQLDMSSITDTIYQDDRCQSWIPSMVGRVLRFSLTRAITSMLSA